MSKIHDTERSLYLEKTKIYQEKIKIYLKKEEMMESFFKNEMDEGSPLKRLLLAEDMISLASNYIILSEVSMSMLKVRNNEILDDAKKVLYKAIFYIENVVSGMVDVPFSDYEDKHYAIATMDSARRYLLVQKLGFAIELLVNAYGANTKWKWNFVDMEGRYAAVAKNMLDLKAAASNTDPRSMHYEATVHHIRLIKRLLMQAADSYRNKYELSTNRIEDFKAGIHFLSALRRFHIIFRETGDAENVKKKLTTWTSKLEADIKKNEEAERTRLD
ncbi:MAG: hypothetical protein LBH43_03105 [Treponema sp.]|jgi:hypothetical protein|nr:hypothetical protein [Treponema sp.]